MIKTVLCGAFHDVSEKGEMGESDLVMKQTGHLIPDSKKDGERVKELKREIDFA